MKPHSGAYTLKPRPYALLITSAFVLSSACEDMIEPIEPIAASASRQPNPRARDAAHTAFESQVDRATERYKHALDDSGIYARYIQLIGASPIRGRVPANPAELLELLPRHTELYGQFANDAHAALEAARLDARAQLDWLGRRYDRGLPLFRPDARRSYQEERDVLAETLAGFAPDDYVLSARASEVLTVEAGRLVTLSPLRLHSLATSGPTSFEDAKVSNLPIFRTCTSPATPCVWPIVYDLLPYGAELLWETNFTRQEVEDIIREDGFLLSLFVNGQPISKGPATGIATETAGYYAATVPGEPCPTGKNCIATNVFVRKVLRNVPQPWTFELRVMKLANLPIPIIEGLDKFGNPIFITQESRLIATATRVVQANPTAGESWFTAALYPTFQHPRCADCHGFGDVAAIAAHHGYSTPKYVQYFVEETDLHLEPSAYVPGAHVMACTSCHWVPLVDNHGKAFHETEWIAPYKDLDVNWKQKTAAQTCARVKANLPTDQLRYQHFHGDGRLFWAVQDPFIPGRGKLESAPPHASIGYLRRDFDEFLRRFDLWNTFKAPCP